jgi:1,6-anhydro-N-acetylmuramate kinase
VRLPAGFCCRTAVWIDPDTDFDFDFDFDTGNDLIDRDIVLQIEPQMDTDGHRSEMGKICVNLCLSVVERMDLSRQKPCPAKD